MERTNEIKYKIEFLSYWHIGSGISGGVDADAVVLRDKDGFPYIPGKTLKGHLRDALQTIAGLNLDVVDIGFINRWFGIEGGRNNNVFSGSLFFENAYLAQSFVHKINKDEKSQTLNRFLFEKISFTAIDKEKGSAKKSSLRSVEVCVPLTLYGRIILSDVSVDDYSEIKEKLSIGMGMIGNMGAFRNRGFGKCRITLMQEDKQ
ncbi:MAG: RAMP superfamily CRISPR-associated protein [Methanolobus sp.]|nr:RAMP superfamily CRISPR-associated protein [Methanolobus sp.]